jgi:hypothetical protein
MVYQGDMITERHISFFTWFLLLKLVWRCEPGRLGVKSGAKNIAVSF